MSESEERIWEELFALLAEFGLGEGRRARARRRPHAGISLREAERELAQVHRREQARLLREAAELKLLFDAEQRPFTLPQPPRRRDWREEVAEEIDNATLDGRPLDGRLLGCCLLRVRAWPGALELARAADELCSCLAGDFLLARARYGAGERREAEAAYERLAEVGATLGLGARVREAAACAAQRRGELSRALALYERAAALGAGLDAELSVLALALATGDRTRARYAADHLELRRPRPRPRELSRALARLRRRWARCPGAPPLRVAPELGPLLIDCICCGDPTLADACFELFG